MLGFFKNVANLKPYQKITISFEPSVSRTGYPKINRNPNNLESSCKISSKETIFNQDIRKSTLSEMGGSSKNARFLKECCKS